MIPSRAPAGCLRGPGDGHQALRAVALICGRAGAARMVEANRQKAPDGRPIDLAKGWSVT